MVLLANARRRDGKASSMISRSAAPVLWSTLMFGVLLLGGALLVALLAGTGELAMLEGRVVDEQGRPVNGATIDALDAGSAVSDAEGVFAIDLPVGPQLVSAVAEGYLSRTQAVEPGTPTQLQLTSDSDGTVSLRFAGDTMFGRRYYDRAEDGDRSDALLPEQASVSEHSALLRHVQPLLVDADLTVVNLESPIIDEPWFDPSAPRPDVFHPSKEFVFASAPEAVEALAGAGVDVVALGNNHMYDALSIGLVSTMEALARAGLRSFGAGRTVDEAWAPAFVSRKGQMFASLGCTTITGREHAIPYAADEDQGGAALVVQRPSSRGRWCHAR